MHSATNGKSTSHAARCRLAIHRAAPVITLEINDERWQHARTHTHTHTHIHPNVKICEKEYVQSQIRGLRVYDVYYDLVTREEIICKIVETRHR